MPRLSIDISPEKHQKLKAIAALKGQSIKDYVIGRALGDAPALTDGRRFRVLAVVDDHSRECLALVADTSLSGHRVVRELDAVIARRGRPAMVVSDNHGPAGDCEAICREGARN